MAFDIEKDSNTGSAIKNLRIVFDNGEILMVNELLYDDLMKLKKLQKSSICDLYGITEDDITSIFLNKRIALSKEILKYINSKVKFRETGDLIDKSDEGLWEDFIGYPIKIDTLKSRLRKYKVSIIDMETLKTKLYNETYL